MLYQWLFTIKFISLLSFAAGNNSSNIPPLDYRYQCLNQSSVPLSITYQINLKDLFTYLSDSASTNSFGHINLDDDHQNMVYGLYLCRGDVNNTLCNSCVQNSTTLLNQHCPNSTSAIMWLPFCVVRYSNQKFFGKLTIKPRVPMFDATQNFSGEFDSDARILMNGLIQKGSEAPLMFGTHVCNINGTQTRHALVQCSRDITREECRTCLRNMVEEVQNCCMEKKVWHVFSPSCVVMYQTQPFFFIDTLPQQGVQ
ncbi:hypothetical protein VNO78_12850 [Psophocarpus tetragonolobus]|uniref:Gnk2-homologous domain-containing protein n=1 Tax=Psophocarpus tetragonolobus TaxID=3891 RepID=A0AAN9XQ51_PSOTE